MSYYSKLLISITQKNLFFQFPFNQIQNSNPIKKSAQFPNNPYHPTSRCFASTPLPNLIQRSSNVKRNSTTFPLLETPRGSSSTLDRNTIVRLDLAQRGQTNSIGGKVWRDENRANDLIRATFYSSFGETERHRAKEDGRGTIEELSRTRSREVSRETFAKIFLVEEFRRASKADCDAMYRGVLGV